MRKAGLLNISQFKTTPRWCAYIVLAGIIISSAAGCDQQQGVLLPSIGYFKASHQILQGVEAANYEFKVNNAEEIWLYEAGVNIGKWGGPSSGTHIHKIIFTGMPANAIPTEDGKFKALLVVSNEKGKQEKELQLSVAAPTTPQAGQPEKPDEKSGDNKSYWLEQTFLSDVSPEPPRDTSNTCPPMEQLPQFGDCPPSIPHLCLKPEEAARLGLTEKCSEEICFSSPCGDEKWYLYKEPPGWCCEDTVVSQSTKANCTEMGGFWSTNKAEAERACQPMCYCCAQDGRVGLVTELECARLRGRCFNNQQAAMEACQPPCWCCVKGSPAGGRMGEAVCTPGQVIQTTESQCTGMGGGCYPSSAAATAACGCK